MALLPPVYQDNHRVSLAFSNVSDIQNIKPVSLQDTAVRPFLSFPSFPYLQEAVPGKPPHHKKIAAAAYRGLYPSGSPIHIAQSVQALYANI